MSFSFNSQDRLLVIAPHPDDESLAMGGLIQRASRAGAALRLLMITNGDNNPWPQRWVEKRWKIGISERQRWGALRQQEARIALEKLGFKGEARFLGLPDQGITTRLLRADQELLELFCCEIRAWNPTHVILPSSCDLHSDHNAVHVLLQLALERTSHTGVPQYHFVVHCKRPDLIPRRVELRLTESELNVKREAILCHNTQLALCRKRFLAFACPEELYYQPTPVQPVLSHHPVMDAYLFAGALNLSVKLPMRFGKECALFIVGESQTAGSLRWRIDLPSSSRKVCIHDTVIDEPSRAATVRIAGRLARVKIPIATVTPFSRLFVKLQHTTIFLDDAGWREVPV